MRLILFLIIVMSAPTALFGQLLGTSKDYYAILEQVLKKESATLVYKQIYNKGLYEATDSLRAFTGVLASDIKTKDSVMEWNSIQRTRLVSQLAKIQMQEWDQHKIYFTKVVNRDVVAEILQDAKASEEMMQKDKTFQIHRVALPLFTTATTAWVYVEFAMVGILDHTITFRENHSGIYFVRKKGNRWHVTGYMGRKNN